MKGAVINTRAKEQHHSASYPRGILMIYSVKGKLTVEEMSNEAIDKFGTQHGLIVNHTRETIIDKVIEYFNSTLRPGEHKRILKHKYYTFNSTFYKKI